MEYSEFTCRRGDGFTLPGAEASYAPDLALEPTHIEVRLAFDLKAARAGGTVTTTVRANRAGARTLRLDAVAFDEVEVSGPRSRYDGRHLHLDWDKPFAAGEERQVEVRYAVTDPITGMRFSRPDEAYPDRPLMVGTDHETERARYWLPCVDYPTVRTTFDFHLTAPRGTTILANGALQDETENGDGTRTVHWRLDKPCPSYLCCLAIGEFTRCDDEEVDGRPLGYFAPPRFTPDQLRRTFGRTPAMMRWLTERLGRPFPYPKYFQVAQPGIGGAMENISLVTWDDLFVLDEALEEEWGDYVDGVNVHEMAHSYFGDDVVCRHFEHSWLKESWATYVETVYWEQNVGEERAHYDLYRNTRAYFKEADERYVRPIVTRTYNSSWDLFDAHLYPGGAWRLHMLRWRVGDETFWKATTDYLATYSGRVVETDDFRRKLEEHSGLNLTRFFDQWIYGKGYPKLKATFKHDAEKGEATLTVEQTQEDEKKGVGLFAFPLEVDVEDEKGFRPLTLELEDKRHTAVFKVKGSPTQVRLDPRCKALFKLDFNPGDDMLKRTLTGAKDVGGRIWAARELIRTGTRANLQSVRNAMLKEPFHGVRIAVLEELGKSGAAEAIEPLAALLRAEADPRAKRFAALACGKMRDPRLRDALLAFLAETQPPWARAAALASLGAQRDDRDLALLDRERAHTDLHRIVASGALRGLGSLRSRGALDTLAEQLPYGAEPETSRNVAVSAFGACARLLDRETKAGAAERLADLTRDPDDRVRMRAGAVLAALELPAAIPALESLRKQQSHQDGARIDRWIARLRKGPPGEETTKLREQVEKLEEKVRKLEERLQDLEGDRRPSGS
ncbi:MAG: M1 family aminopeptidase [Planctomycetota bacterium]|jgi:aminopeptidase N